MPNHSTVTLLLVDLVAVVILVFFAFNGRRRGLVKTLSGLVALILAFYLAGALARMTAPYFSERYVSPWLYESILPKMQPAEQTNEGSVNSQLGDALDQIGFPQDGVQDFLGDFKADLYDSVESAVDGASKSLGYKLTFAGCYLLYFLIFLIALRLLARLLDRIVRIPGLNFINRTLGLILGLLSGYLTILVVSYILTRTGFVLSESLVSQTYVLRFLLSVSPF